EILNQQTVELIFIDLQMPQLTGMEIMEMFNENHNFVITSAYPEHALNAFQFHVVDFLVKPITFQKFYRSVKKYQDWQNTFQTDKKNDFLLIKADGKHYKIEFSSIFYIEGMRDYIRIHTHDKKIVALKTMKELVEELPEGKFIRIHRSFIVSKVQIETVEGRRIQLKHGKYLPIGNTYRQKINKWLRQQ